MPTNKQDHRIVFCDTETTSLGRDRRAWEIAVIVRRPGSDDFTQSWFIAAEDLDLGNADPKSLTIGRFYDRHPTFATDKSDRWKLKSEFDVLTEVEKLTRGATIVGAVPSFDTEVLAERMRANGICPSWYYRPRCVETLAVGWLRNAMPSYEADLTGRSDDLFAALGLDMSVYERHTAMGDAAMARDAWDVVMNPKSLVAGWAAERRSLKAEVPA